MDGGQRLYNWEGEAYMMTHDCYRLKIRLHRRRGEDFMRPIPGLITIGSAYDLNITNVLSPAPIGVSIGVLPLPGLLVDVKPTHKSLGPETESSHQYQTENEQLVNE